MLPPRIRECSECDILQVASAAIVGSGYSASPSLALADTRGTRWPESHAAGGGVPCFWRPRRWGRELSGGSARLRSRPSLGLWLVRDAARDRCRCGLAPTCLIGGQASSPALMRPHGAGSEKGQARGATPPVPRLDERLLSLSLTRRRDPRRRGSRRAGVAEEGGRPSRGYFRAQARRSNRRSR
jgi:hypothetical protein